MDAIDVARERVVEMQAPAVAADEHLAVGFRQPPQGRTQARMRFRLARVRPEAKRDGIARDALAQCEEGEQALALRSQHHLAPAVDQRETPEEPQLEPTGIGVHLDLFTLRGPATQVGAYARRRHLNQGRPEDFARLLQV